MADGWFHVEGVREGPRTLHEQMLGLELALVEARGKTVCDLGCAEGLIAMEFAHAGATLVYGCDTNSEMIDYANSIRGELPVEFRHVNLNDDEARPEALKRSYDIVLALAILHKLKVPSNGLALVVRLQPALAVLRLPAGFNGRIVGKHSPNSSCEVNVAMARAGYRLELQLSGPRDEPVQYWRRT